MARALSTSVDQINEQQRTSSLVFKYKDLRQKKAALEHDILVHKTNEIVERKNFFSQWQLESPCTDAFGSDAITAISSALNYWAEHSSFYICSNCNSILPVKMPYNFLKKLQ